MIFVPNKYIYYIFIWYNLIVNLIDTIQTNNLLIKM